MFPILNVKQGKTEHYYENLTFPVTFTGSEIDVKIRKEITPRQRHLSPCQLLRLQFVNFYTAYLPRESVTKIDLFENALQTVAI